MYGFPRTTEFNRRIPKQKFYEHIPTTPGLKRVFIDQIRLIQWKNKLATQTMNVAAGETVAEIEVFEVELHRPDLDEAVLRQIDRAIPYHILFILTCEGRAQGWIGVKEAGPGGPRVGRYYHTDWMPESDLRFRPDGLTMDTLYEGLVRQVAGAALVTKDGDTLAMAVARSEERQKLDKQIAILENKLRKEKQLNRRMEINGELKKLCQERDRL